MWLDHLLSRERFFFEKSSERSEQRAGLREQDRQAVSGAFEWPPLWVKRKRNERSNLWLHRRKNRFFSNKKTFQGRQLMKFNRFSVIIYLLNVGWELTSKVSYSITRVYNWIVHWKLHNKISVIEINKFIKIIRNHQWNQIASADVKQRVDTRECVEQFAKHNMAPLQAKRERSERTNLWFARR